MLARRNQMIGFNPFRTLDEFEKSIFREPFATFDTSALAAFKTDIKEEGDNFILEADLPGFAKENISIDVDGDVLTISAERHSEHEDEDKQNNYVRCERSYGSYMRQFDISAVDAEKITAKCEDGVLRLTMPKKANLAPQKHHLEIQ